MGLGFSIDPLVARGAERLAVMRTELRLGLPVLMTDRDNNALVLSVDTMTPERYGAITADGARPQFAVSRLRGEALGMEIAAGARTVWATLPAPLDIEHVKALAEPGLEAVRAPPPQTGASPGSVVHDAAVALAGAAQLLPAVLVLPLADARAAALRGELSEMAAGEVLSELAFAPEQTPVSNAPLPMALSDRGRVHVFRSGDGSTEHYAISIGSPDAARPMLTRLHSACFTGDVLGSLKCDCGPQLRASMARMAEAGGGLLLYLNQEGRGIGLANKMRAYALQDRGFDTVEANHMLGFADDERDFRIGAKLLDQLGIGRVRLMTNNPAKVTMLAQQGIDVVERVPLAVGRTPQNAGYLSTKAAKSGHLFA